MTYSHYRMSNGTTVVTLEGLSGIDLLAAALHLFFNSSRKIDGTPLYIFSDHGDRSRFLAFEKAVEEARG